MLYIMLGSITLIILSFVELGSCILLGVSGMKVAVCQHGKMMQKFGYSWWECCT